MPSIIFKTNRNNLDIVAQAKYLPTFKEVISILVTFSLTVFAWIFFRAENIGHAVDYIAGIFSSSLFSLPEVAPRKLYILLLLFIMIEWAGREGQYAIAHLGESWKRPVRLAMYYSIVISIYWFAIKGQEFIYFQF